jgi:hypothetical protein
MYLYWPARIFTVEEVEHTLFSMDFNKAHEPNNIPVEFFHHCRNLTKHHIMHIFKKNHEGSLAIKGSFDS